MRVLFSPYACRVASLTSGQTEFARQLASRTGLNSRVIASWLLAEESGGAAQQREKQGNNNWLNIGYFDSGAGGLTKDKVWSDPAKAAAATADFLKGTKYGASKGIRSILDTAGGDQSAQIKAIAGSGWASSGYDGGNTLRRLLQEAPAPGAAGRGDGSGGAARTASVSEPVDPTTSSTSVTQSDVPDLAGLLGQLQADSKPAAPASVGLAAPSFSAAPALPQGYQQAQSSGGGGAGQGSDLSSLLQGVAAMQPALSTETTQTTTSPASLPASREAGGQASPSAGRGASRQAGGPITDVKRLLSRAAAIDSQHLPYVYGGGHSAKASKPGTPLDCSSAVSKVLGIDPRVSGDFERFGSAGADKTGKGVTVYANKGHVLMEIEGRFWGTSRSNPDGGAGWIDKSQISPEYLKGFTARHLAAAR